MNENLSLKNGIVKYFRIFRTRQILNETIKEFMGVINAMMYVDKDVELEDLMKVIYRVEVVSHTGEVLSFVDISVIE